MESYSFSFSYLTHEPSTSVENIAVLDRSVNFFLANEATIDAPKASLSLSLSLSRLCSFLVIIERLELEANRSQTLRAFSTCRTHETLKRVCTVYLLAYSSINLLVGLLSSERTSQTETASKTG